MKSASGVTRGPSGPAVTPSLFQQNVTRGLGAPLGITETPLSVAWTSSATHGDAAVPRRALLMSVKGGIAVLPNGMVAGAFSGGESQ